METAWDWITVFIFAGLATLLIHRSQQEVPQDKLWQYGPPSVGCAVANYVGNEGYDVVAALIVVGIVWYIHKILKVDFSSFRK